MGSEVLPDPVSIVMGVLFSQEALLARAKEECESLFGPVEMESETVSFEYTAYYDEEMGKGVNRCFWSFNDPFPRGALADAKLATNRIERELSINGRRKVNLDPGLLTLESLVLATTKPYYHRIYLSKGIYAETTLAYRKGGFEVMPWTYPDYREEWVRQFFLSVRKNIEQKAARGLFATQ